MSTQVDRLRLNAELMRLVRERSTIAPGSAGALARIRNASAMAAALQKLGLQAPEVSIYNSGTDPTEPTMTTPAHPMIPRLLPAYAKHGEALAAVREVEAAGGKPTGVQKAAVTRTRTDLDYEIKRYNDYGRNPGGAPSIEELAAAYEAKLAAEKQWLEELAGMPTLTLDELSAQAVAALELVTPREKYGTREAEASTMTADGSVITCTAMDDRRRGRGYNWEIKRVIQFKKDGAVISKASLLSILGGRDKQEINEALRSQFEAQAPALEQDYYDYIVRAFEYQKEQRGGKVPAWVDPKKDPGADVIGELRQHSTIITPEGGRPGVDSWLELDEVELRKRAKRYGEDVAVRWFYKTNAKLGALENPTLHNDKGGYVEVSGERGGRKVFMRQQRIIKAAPTTGRLFHQFPALLYIDGKFFTEEAYARLFGDK